MTKSKVSVAGRLALFGAIAIAAVLTPAMTYVVLHLKSSLHESALHALHEKTDGIALMVASFDARARTQSQREFNMLASKFTQGFTLDTSRKNTVGSLEVPALQYGGKDVALDFAIPDEMTVATGGGVATIFVRNGDDFVRVTTSLKKQDGTRALGTALGKEHPAYAAMMRGEEFVGRAELFGKLYMTKYGAIKRGSEVIGILFVGTDLSDLVEALKVAMEGQRVGDTGFMYAMDARPGKDQGRLLLHPTKQGVRPLERDDPAAKAFVADLVQGRFGTRENPWNSNTGDATGAAERVAVYSYADEWQWLIVADIPIVELDALARQAVLPLIASSAGAAIVLALVIFFLTRRLVGTPLGELGHAIDRFAGGDLATSLSVRRADEIGRIAEAAEHMRRQFASIVSGILRGAQSVEVASKEISAGNHDLSHRTEEQASSLEETAASLEELTSTVKQNAQNAHRANELSGSASRVAARGGEVVGDVVTTMAAINQSSRKISDIIGVIDGIAFQTNILALNAAVEAARAGEQGRGFAVVASEVRSLAQRSAGAAKEIKGLIEESVGKVDAGQTLVEEAGRTMTEIVASIGEVSVIVGEIANASEEQSAGIAQVNDAIGHMDHVTQQNAALVEQSAAAAESMHTQAEQLAATVSVFKLGPQPVEAVGTGSGSVIVPMGAPEHDPSELSLSRAPASRTERLKTGTDD